ncbi:CvfB family protein [Flectobacillus major]|uniref:CvfB family protein n=1 Tax=Flectobacillus major TaxID=103 RepID=UPI000425FB0E|nr:S1-like domain-containing RNA-binding protein [Flectobacillus major]
MEEQTQRVQLGKYNRLEVIKELDFGLYLDGFEDEILIPRSYVPEGTKIGDFLDVFIYRDSEDRLIATTWKPFAQVGDFAYLEVKDVTKLGVFLNWGLVKDLLLPFGEQTHKMAVGRKYLVKIYVDEQTERIVASAKIDRFLAKEVDLQVGQEVNIIPYEYTDLGIKALINEKYIGVIYKSEVFKKIELGTPTKAYVKKLREDSKIDLTLEIQGYDRIHICKQTIINKLKLNQNTLPFNDKTDASIIYDNLEMSKKDFKKAIGGLLKEKLIEITEEGISLL